MAVQLPVGTLVNVGAILVGSLVGAALHARFPQRIQTIVFQALGLCTFLVGMQMALKVENILIVIFSLVLGGICGEWWRLEERLHHLGGWLRRRAKSRDGRFTEGFVAASLLFCVGAMAIVGSLDEGLRQDRTVLLTKALLDGFASVALAATYGIGVLFSCIPLALYQGGITLFAGQMQGLASPVITNQVSAVGGLLIIGISCGLLEIKTIRLASLLPALLIVIVLTLLLH